MKKSLKSTLTELTVASVLIFVVTVVFSISLSSCGSVPKAGEKPVAAEEKVEPKKEEKKPVKKEYTKTDFVEDLQRKLEADGPDAALIFFDEKIPQKYADDFGLRFLKASIQVSGGKLEDADALCKELLSIKPDNEDVIGLAAAIAKMRGNNEERNQNLKMLLAKDPGNPVANVEIGTDLFMKKNYKSAIIHYKKALAREPYNEDALLGTGQCQYYLERDDEAKETFSKLVKIDPYNIDAYLYLGKIAYANDEYKVASDYAKKALDIAPENYECNMDWGMYERYLGHFDNALKAWTKAISIEPEYFLAYAYRAGIYDEQDKIKEAMDDYLNVIKYNPQYYYAYESIGVLAVHEKNWDLAKNAFLKCWEKNKNNVSYPLMVTYCFYMQNDPVNAKKYSDQVLRKMDRNSIEYSMLRVFHDKAGENPLKKRISSMSNANQRGKMNYYMGLFYEMCGYKEGSKEYYAKVVALNAPMFFEYRLAEWSVKEQKKAEALGE